MSGGKETIQAQPLKQLSSEDLKDLSVPELAVFVRAYGEQMIVNGLPYDTNDGTLYGEQAQQAWRQTVLPGEGVVGFLKAFKNSIH